MIQQNIFYNGRTYSKHKKQPYYYIGSKGNIYSRCMHRQIYFDNYGEIPKGFDVHHKDGNPYNNSPENFELKTRSAHQRDHINEKLKANPGYLEKFQKAGIKIAPQWHKSSEGLKWHSENAKKNGFGSQHAFNKFKDKEYHCQFCKNIYDKKTPRSKFCSNKCKSAYRRSIKKDMEQRICEYCLNGFTAPKYSKIKTCSRVCAKTLYWVQKNNSQSSKIDC